MQWFRTTLSTNQTVQAFFCLPAMPRIYVSHPIARIAADALRRISYALSPCSHIHHCSALSHACDPPGSVTSSSPSTVGHELHSLESPTLGISESGPAQYAV